MDTRQRLDEIGGQRRAWWQQQHPGGAPDWLKTGLKGANNIVSVIGSPGSIMTSADMQNNAEQVTGPFYEPKTLTGKVLRAI